jgi:HEAT repeat protein
MEPDMNGFIVLVVVSFVPPLPSGPELPPRPLRATATATATIENALKQLSLPCPDRIHINEPIFTGEEGARFCYRAYDLYDDCADAMDLLVQTKHPIDDDLVQLASRGKELPERYRAASVLVQRGNQRVVPILETMAASTSAEERYLAWDIYEKGISKKHLPPPRSVAEPLARCRKEKNHYVRSMIMDFLGACQAKEAVPLLIEGLRADHSRERHSALWALGNIRDPGTVEAIIEAEKQDHLGKHLYHSALGRIGSEAAVDHLIQHLNDDCFAIEALFETGSPRALPALRKHLDRLRKKEKADELHLAMAEIAVLRLEDKDPRERLMCLSEDRKQSEWMRTHALEALSHYDTASLAVRLLNSYRAEKDDWMRMFYIRLLRDLPGEGITQAMVTQALTDSEHEYYHSHNDLRKALNHRLNTSYRTMERLLEHLRCERTAKSK